MSKFKIVKTAIEDLVVIEPTVFGDKRGFFLESYNHRELRAAGFDKVFVQDNFSRSSKGVLRGLHFQKQYPQGKLVKVTRGEVFDVAVDLRKGSPTYGKWHGVVLDDEDHWMFYIPEGFAHGFLVLSEIADFQYKCTDYYHPKDEGGVIWNDPEINIQWPLENITPLLSSKDEGLPALINAEIPFVYEGKSRS